MTGGTGADAMYGGMGDDRFVFATGSGADDIIDFAQGGQADVIDLASMTGVADAAAALALAVQSGSDVVLDFGGGDMLTLHGVDLINLTESHFLV